MSTGNRPSARSGLSDAPGGERPACPRCGSYLRAGHAPDPDNPHGLCDPCHALVASCAPYIDGGREPAPPDVNLVELVAGLALTHDALHPGEPLYLREALAAHGVEADHVKVWQTVGKLQTPARAGDDGRAAGAGLPGRGLDVGGEAGEEYGRTPLAWAGLARKSDGGSPATWPDHRARAPHRGWRECDQLVQLGDGKGAAHPTLGADDRQLPVLAPASLRQLQDDAQTGRVDAVGRVQVEHHQHRPPSSSSKRRSLKARLLVMSISPLTWMTMMPSAGRSGLMWKS